MPMPDLLRDQSLNIATALLFGLSIWRLGLSPELPAVLAFVVGGVLLAVIDWKVQRLPRRIVYLTLAGVASGLVFASVVEWDWRPLATAALGAALFSNAFYLIWFFTTRLTGMTVLGFGDVRLAAVLGLLLGWYGLPYVLYGALLGHLFAIVIVVATCVHRRQFAVRYAFGPPLIAGTLAVVLLQA
jgi:leader peptidase (prepilin peptidase)/N-methyltransferase